MRLHGRNESQHSRGGRCTLELADIDTLMVSLTTAATTLIWWSVQGDVISFEQEIEKLADWPNRLVQPTLPVSPFPVQSLLGHPVQECGRGARAVRLCTECTPRHRPARLVTQRWILLTKMRFYYLRSWANSQPFSQLRRISWKKPSF